MSTFSSKVLFILIIPLIFLLNQFVHGQQKFALLQRDGVVDQLSMKELKLTFDNDGNLIRTINGVRKTIAFSSVKKIYFIEKINKFPIANAGADQSVNESITVSLDGSASSDPDGNPLTYKWTAPTGITLAGSSSQKPTFIAPEVKKDSTLVFTLVVNDGQVDSDPSIVKINVLNVIKVGIPDLSTNDFKVFPNPTKGEIIIEMSALLQESFHIQLINTLGKVVLQKTMINRGSNLINLSGVASGLYFIKVSFNGKIYSNKIVLQH